MKIDVGVVLELLRMFGCDVSLVPETPSDYFRMAICFLWAVVVFIVLFWSVRKTMTDLFRGLR